MSGACTIPADTGAVRAVIAAVDCNTRDFAHQGYVTLTGGEAFQSALTLALTVYVALVGYRLLFAADGARLTDAPRMALKVGAVLALVTSWNLFETLAFDLAAKAPAEIASAISPGGGKPGAQDPVGRLQVAYDQLLASASALATQARETAQSAIESTAPTAVPSTAPPAIDSAKAETGQREQTAARALDTAAAAVLTIQAGAVAVDMIAIGILCAIGPIFVTLLLFDQTRGLFEGWVRAVVAAALASMSAWALILLMTTILQPWLVTLAQQRELKMMDPAPAMTAASIVFVFTAAQIAMAAGSAVIAFGFRLALPRREAPARTSATQAAEAAEGWGSLTRVSRASLLAEQLRRSAAMTARRGTVAAGEAVRLVSSQSVIEPRLAAAGFGRAGLSRDHLQRRGPRR